MAISSAEAEGKLGVPNNKEEITGQAPLTIFFEDERALEKELVGGKGFGLAMLKSIPEIAKKVPDGFTITTPVYDMVIQQNPQIAAQVKELDEYSESWVEAKLKGDGNAVTDWERKIVVGGACVKEGLEKVMLLPELRATISESYDKLCEKIGEKDTDVAVRSSGGQEDGNDKSFAGQNSTFLNRRGKDAVIEAVKGCIASQFEARAIVYRNNERLKISEEKLKKDQGKLSDVLEASKGFSHVESRLAVVVQKMVESSVSGVALSIDPITGASRINIELNNGLGEAVVGGEATPDFFQTDRNNPENIVGRSVGKKSVKTAYKNGGTENVAISTEEAGKFAADDEKVKEISRDIVAIRSGLGKEVDTEFGFDRNGNLHWLQARPETVGSKKSPHVVEMREYRIPENIAKKAEAILKGGIVGSPGVSSGTKLIASTVEEAIRIMESPENEGKEWILVTDMTTPDWVPVMKKVKGIITRHGGRTCHAAIVSRELRVPALVGTEEEIEALRDDSITEITLDVKNMKVYKGKLPLEEVGENIDVREILEHPTDTIVGINMSMPDEAKKLHALAELGDKFKISLLRIEFLLGEIGVHVNALIDFDKGVFKQYESDPKKRAEKEALQRQITERLAKEGYTSGVEYFVGKLSEGIADIAANFPNSEVILRTTDFKTNEYENLIGGKMYEEKENNPMIGWRGLVRSLCPENREGFKLELEVIKRVWDDMGYKNIRMMLPVVRDPLEINGNLDEMERWYGKGFRSADAIIKEVGLKRGKDGLKVGIMIEDETNVERLDDYINAGIDFGSIGSNDLTQLVLGTDRDNEKLQKIPRYSEMNPAVINKIVRVIRKCRERGIEIGICGDAPSSNPEIVKILTQEKISSLGVTPDVYLKTYRSVRAEEEKRKFKKKGIMGTVLFRAKALVGRNGNGNSHNN